ncbi:MAG: hypothetical protein KatS3mg118_2808 [Paracoccaceae bacterium]|nr:MAG: hypothetical protein KatS3mg118_2808 [Paracoccaceae bacterium]
MCMEESHHVPVWVKLAPFAAMLAGLGLAWWFYILDPSVPGRLAASNPAIYRFLLNKWYIDEIYDWLLVRPALWLARTLWQRGDGATIDGGINGLAMRRWRRSWTRVAVRVQTGLSVSTTPSP